MSEQAKPSVEKHDAGGSSDNVRARIQASFDKQGFMGTIGAELGEVERGSVQILLPMQHGVTQQHGFFHGGAVGAVADNAGGYAALTMYDERSEVMAVEYKINFLAPAIGDHLEAVGTVLKSGRTLTTVRVDVYAHSDGGRKLVAAAQGTVFRVDA